MPTPPPKDKKKPGVSKPPAPPGLGVGAQQELHNPAGPKPGQGMDPMEAMTNGLGLMAMPPPPAPGAPMGPNGLPIGGNIPSSDPMMDQNMMGSSLFQALAAQLDPYSAGPLGHGQLDPPPDINDLLGMLALQKAGQGSGINPSGVFNEPTHPGETVGLQPFNVIQ